MATREPKTARGRATRERIVDAAAALTEHHGVAGTSLDDVCARARVSRGQLYHYFDNRADLMRAVVAGTTDAVLSAQEQLLAGLDSWPAIEAWFAEMVAVQEQRGARGGCPIGSLVGQLAERDDGARSELARGFDRWERHLRDGLERMRLRGELCATADPQRLATATMASLQGGLLLTQTRRNPQQLRIALDGALVQLHAEATADRVGPTA